MDNAHEPKCIAIIPARLESARLPKKLLLPLGEKKILQHVYERAKQIPELSKTYIATHNPEIIAHAKQWNADFIKTSDKPQSGTERILEALNTLTLFPQDIVLNLQGDEPFLDVEAVSRLCLWMQKTPNITLATLAIPITKKERFLDPNVVKVVLNANQQAMYFSRAPIPFPREDTQTFNAWEHAGIYAYRVHTLKRIAQMQKTEPEQIEKLEQLRWLVHGEPIHVLTGEFSFFSIDTLEDWKQAQKLL